MKLVKCEANGHYYDSDRFTSCPFCNQTELSTVDGKYTKPLDSEIPTGTTDPGDFSKTIGIYDNITSNNTDPVVGWLVAISGAHLGEDFKLKAGRNFIGRSEDMDIPLTGDQSISREKHAIILYEPKSNMFLVQPGEAKQLFYLNDKVVLEAMKISAYDVISLGETNLLFIPCCSSKFNWDSVIKENEETK